MKVFATVTLPNGSTITSIDIVGDQDINDFRNMFRQAVRGDTHSISFVKRNNSGVGVTMVTIPDQLLKMCMIEITELR